MNPLLDHPRPNLKCRRRVSRFPVIACLCWHILSSATLRGQVSAPQPHSDSLSVAQAQRVTDIENRLDAVTDALAQAQDALQKSMLEIETLRGQLAAVRGQTATVANDSHESPVLKVSSDSSPAAGNPARPPQDDLEALREEQEAMQAEIAQHEQIKVESASKYPLRLTGLVLFNAFSNAGVVDNVYLPTLALPRVPGHSHGSAGANMEQTLVGLEATGPKFAGARSFADISMDFFGGTTTNAYGYSAPTAQVRLRQAQVSLDWNKTTVQAAYTVPLISPLSPTSYATVAEPAFAASGNLWTWSPQVRVEQRVDLSDERSLALEAGLIDAESPGYTSIQLESPVEASRRPGYEGRISYHDRATPSAHPFVLGIGGYSAEQYYSSSSQIHAWAATADWQIPILKWFEVTGEAYRGRAIGGLGGGLYKDIVEVTNPATGLPQINGVETVGGWSQLKVRFSPTLETNAAFGLDDALSGNFYGIIPAPGTSPTQQYARNSSVMANIIFRPKTYLIFSPEYRHLLTWPYAGSANVANVFTLSAGYQF
jgi:hypothetical protein